MPIIIIILINIIVIIINDCFRLNSSAHYSDVLVKTCFSPKENVEQAKAFFSPPPQQKAARLHNVVKTVILLSPCEFNLRQHL